MTARKPARDSDAYTIADSVHAAAIRLLRRLRRTDTDSGLSAPKSSALSVLVFGGAQTLKDLAAAEQVRAPTMSRLVAELEATGLATKTEDATDRRGVRIAATAKGKALLEAGRQRRLQVLTAQIEALGSAEQQTLRRAADILLRLTSQA